MAAREPTEEPTPRRLSEARRRGQVAVSRDLVSAAATAAGLGTVVVVGAGATASLVAYFRVALAAAGRQATVSSAETAASALAGGLTALTRGLAAPLSAALAAALLVGLAQTRGLLAVGAVEPRLDRLSIGKNLHRILTGGGAFQVGKGAVKLALVAALVGWTLAPHLAGVLGLTGAPSAAVLAALGLLARRLVASVAVVGLALGVVDLLVVRRAHRRGLRMTRDEVRREHKETEGDPLHRAERQRLQREVLEQRMIADVRKADFVVVNPEHIAVALRYDRARDGAPVVVASGERLLAERIKQVARESGVPIFRDVTLARSLRAVAEGDEIPAALYEAVAAVIRVVQGLPDVASETGPAPDAPGIVTPAAPGIVSPGPSVPGGTGWRRA